MLISCGCLKNFPNLMMLLRFSRWSVYDDGEEDSNVKDNAMLFEGNVTS